MKKDIPQTEFNLRIKNLAIKDGVFAIEIMEPDKIVFNGLIESCIPEEIVTINFTDEKGKMIKYILKSRGKNLKLLK